MQLADHLTATAQAMRQTGERLENARPTDYAGVLLANELQAAAARVAEYVEEMKTGLDPAAEL